MYSWRSREQNLAAACRRCADREPHQNAIVLVRILGGKLYTMRRMRGTSTDDWHDGYQYPMTLMIYDEPIEPNTSVTLTCRKCKTKIGPITGRRIFNLWKSGRGCRTIGYDEVLLLPLA